ncbi:GTP:AMP phosphotransferase AK3, mitochondrial-like [Styela clava]
MRFTGLRRAIHALVMGPPGSGKGTVSTRIRRDFDMHHISSGDLLRSGIMNNAKHATMAKEYIDTGKLVPDGVMVSLVLSQLKNIPSYTSWVLDGFPRTLFQAESLYHGERIDTVINLDVPFDTIMERLSGRWTHLSSGRVYNEGFNPPHKPGFDDLTGEPLVQRDDDKPETIHQRQKTYVEQTQPLLDFFEEKLLLHSFSGTETDTIYPHILEYLKTLHKTQEKSEKF